MKKLLSVTLILFLFMMSCAPEGEKPLTSEQKETLQSEVAKRVDEIVAGANKMDLETMKEIYWNDPSFLAVSFDKTFGYEGYMKDTEDIWSGMSMINFQEMNRQIMILDNQTAYAVFGGFAEGETQEGQEMKIEDFYASMLFRKVDGTWKVAGTHESGIFVVMEQDTSEVAQDASGPN